MSAIRIADARPRVNPRLRDGRPRGWWWVDNATLDVYLPRVGPIAWAVYTYLVRRAGPDGHCWPSYARIARDTGISRRSAIRAVATLVEAGLVAVTPRQDAAGDATSHDYVVLGGAHESPPGDTDDPTGGAPESPPVVTEMHPKKTHFKETHWKAGDLRAAQVWEAIRETAPRLPPGLDGTLGQLTPLALVDGVLTLGAPTTTLARRWARHGTAALVAASPCPLVAVAVWGPDRRDGD